MILSSSDILRILGADAIIRQEAKLAITEGRPGLGTDDTVYIYIEKYPAVEDFEATWKIWVQDNSGMGKYVLDAMTSLLPNFDFKGQYYTTTDFASDRTVVKSQEEIDREEFQDRFSGLQKGVEDRLSTVRDGRDGKDGRDGVDGLPGKDGRDGIDGRDGKDLVATEAELFDLQDVEQGIQMERGQVLTWNGTKWTNLYVRQTMSAGGAVGGTTASGDTGVSSTIAWTYHPHDHTEEPNSGHFHTDSSNGDLVTKFHVSDETSRGNNVEVLLRDLLQQGYDRIYVALGEDLSQAHLYAITGYLETLSGFELTVVHVETAGTEPDYQNAKGYEFLFTKSAVSGGSGIPEAPIDGNYYVRQNGSWIDLRLALSSLGDAPGEPIDGGNFTTGFSSAGDNNVLDGGNFTTGTSNATKAGVVDGGDYTSGSSGSTYNV